METQWFVDRSLESPTPCFLRFRGRVSFNYFPHFTKLLVLSFRRRSGHSQTFLRLTTRLGALGRRLTVYEASPPRVTNASWVLDAAQSTQGLGLVLTTQISPLNSIILHLWFGSHKERLERAQEVVKRLWKWSGISNPREWRWSAFYRESEKLAVGAVRPVWWSQLDAGHSLKETLWIGKFGLRLKHVRLWPDLSGGA
jgi:hypothetical protein